MPSKPCARTSWGTSRLPSSPTGGGGRLSTSSSWRISLESSPRYVDWKCDVATELLYVDNDRLITLTNDRRCDFEACIYSRSCCALHLCWWWMLVVISLAPLGVLHIQRPHHGVLGVPVRELWLWRCPAEVEGMRSGEMIGFVSLWRLRLLNCSWDPIVRQLCFCFVVTPVVWLQIFGCKIFKAKIRWNDF